MIDLSNAFSSAASAKILVAIAFHYKEERIKYLAEVIRSLCGFVVAQIEIVVMTNATDLDDIKKFLRACTTVSAGVTIDIVSFVKIANPHHLPWGYKHVMKGRFLAEDSQYTHFIYLEDDISISFDNFLYFLSCRDPLSAHGLIPSFMRFEYSQAENAWISPDLCNAVSLDRPKVIIGATQFINLPNPYIGFFIMDRELVDEHRRSPVFDFIVQAKEPPFEIRERAAVGLTFEHVPAGFDSRYVVPVNAQKLPLPHCLVRHLPYNYADDGVVRVTIDKMFE